MSSRDLLRHAAATGWTASRTNGNHIKLSHPMASNVVYCAATPSDHRAMANTLAQMRRVLPAEPTAPKPERPKRKPKSPPRKRQVEQAVEWQRPPEPEPPHGVGGSAPRRRPVPGGPRLAMTRWL